MKIYRKLSMYSAWLLLALYVISLTRALTFDVESLERKGAIVQSMIILYITPFPLIIYLLASLATKISIYRKLLMIIPIATVPTVVMISNPILLATLAILSAIIIIVEGVLLGIESK